MEHVTLPLANFSMTLPAEWGMPLGWSLTLIPILLTIAGLLFHLFGKQLLGSLGIPFKMVSSQSIILFNSNHHKNNSSNQY